MGKETCNVLGAKWEDMSKILRYINDLHVVLISTFSKWKCIKKQQNRRGDKPGDGNISYFSFVCRFLTFSFLVCVSLNLLALHLFLLLFLPSALKCVIKRRYLSLTLHCVTSVMREWMCMTLTAEKYSPRKLTLSKCRSVNHKSCCWALAHTPPDTWYSLLLSHSLILCLFFRFFVYIFTTFLL